MATVVDTPGVLGIFPEVSGTPTQVTYPLPSSVPMSEDLIRIWSGSLHVFQRSDREVEQIFNTLSAQWLRETSIESDVGRIVFHPAYQRIIGLGPQAVPFMLRDLEQSHHHWFWALTAITGEDVAEAQTTVSAAVEAWVAWGRSHGLIDG